VVRILGSHPRDGVKVPAIEFLFGFVFVSLFAGFFLASFLHCSS
jgi:hypothetical protein